jgi:negative regulator of sigma E activity
MGAVNIYSSLLDDHHVTVVGEVPQKTVQMIAESISVQ